MVRCVTEREAVLSAVRDHAEHARLGPALAMIVTPLRRCTDSAPMRAASAIGNAFRSGPLVAAPMRAILTMLLLSGRLFVAAQAPLLLAALGLATLWTQRSMAASAGRRRGGRKVR